MILFYAILVGLGAFRLWRILAEDSITEPIRYRIYDRASRAGWEGRAWNFVADLISCVWCIGFWYAGALSWLVADLEGYNPAEFAIVWLAGSTIAGATRKAVES